MLALLYGYDSLYLTTLTVLQLIFCLNSILAWVMKTDLAIKLIEKWSYDYIKMDCEEGKCYGVLAVCLGTLPSPILLG